MYSKGLIQQYIAWKEEHRIDRYNRNF